jgi:hypothetical protein
VRTMVRAGARVGAGWRSAAPGASSRNVLAARWGGAGRLTSRTLILSRCADPGRPLLLAPLTLPICRRRFSDPIHSPQDEDGKPPYFPRSAHSINAGLQHYHLARDVHLSLYRSRTSRPT